MNIIRTKMRDIEKVLELYEAARKFMKENGNPNQWGDNYPQRELIESDIIAKKSYICVEDGQIIGTFYFAKEVEPTYLKIVEGKWLNDLPYGVIHRITTLRDRRGIASFCLDWCFKQCGNIRIDTHRKNIPMINTLKKNGYIQCGIIYLENGDERIAFHKEKELI